MKTSEYPYYQPPFEEYNKLQSEVIPFADKDCNLVLSFPTATGKTAIAEAVMAFHLSSGCRVAYISPFKGIGEERRSDWSESSFFSRYSIGILSSDYSRTRVAEMDSDIVVSTIESFDSTSRRNPDWLKTLSVVVVDEAHILSTERRGPALEASVIRLASINPGCRVVFMSGTMSNARELAVWLKSLNGKPTRFFKSSWRPHGINVEIHESRGFSDTIDKASRIALGTVKGGRKCVVFVQSKVVGRKIVKRIRAGKTGCSFHNASLSFSKRQQIEEMFKDKSSPMRVLVSTSTLGTGVNIIGDSGEHLVIAGVSRAGSPVEVSEINQMIGRSGRKMEGSVDVIIESSVFAMVAPFLEKEGSVAVDSVLLASPESVAFHSLPLVSRPCFVGDILEFFKKSLGAGDDLESVVMDSIGLLESMKMVRIEGETVIILPLGLIALESYLPPEDVRAMASNLLEVYSLELLEHEVSPAWVLGNIPSSMPDSMGGTMFQAVDEFAGDIPAELSCRSVLGVYLWHTLMGGGSAGTFSHAARALKSDSGRRITALYRICSAFNLDSRATDFVNLLSLRVKANITRELVPYYIEEGGKGVAIRRLSDESDGFLN